MFMCRLSHFPKMNCIDCCRLIPFFKIEAQLTYNVVSITAVPQSDSETYIHIYIYTHTHTFFFKIFFFFKYSFPLWLIMGNWIYFPVLYSKTLLFTHSPYNSLHPLTPSSDSIHPPPLQGEGQWSVSREHLAFGSFWKEVRVHFCSKLTGHIFIVMIF